MQLNVKKETEDVIAELLALNLDAHAKAIQLAIEGGCTGTEIIMGIRHELQKVKLNQLPPPLQGKIKVLVREIDKLTS